MGALKINNLHRIRNWLHMLPGNFYILFYSVSPSFQCVFWQFAQLQLVYLQFYNGDLLVNGDLRQNETPSVDAA